MRLTLFNVMFVCVLCVSVGCAANRLKLCGVSNTGGFELAETAKELLMSVASQTVTVVAHTHLDADTDSVTDSVADGGDCGVWLSVQSAQSAQSATGVVVTLEADSASPAVFVLHSLAASVHVIGMSSTTVETVGRLGLLAQRIRARAVHPALGRVLSVHHAPVLVATTTDDNVTALAAALDAETGGAAASAFHLYQNVSVAAAGTDARDEYAALGDVKAVQGVPLTGALFAQYLTFLLDAISITPEDADAVRSWTTQAWVQDLQHTARRECVPPRPVTHVLSLSPIEHCMKEVLLNVPSFVAPALQLLHDDVAAVHELKALLQSLEGGSEEEEEEEEGDDDDDDEGEDEQEGSDDDDDGRLDSPAPAVISLPTPTVELWARAGRILLLVLMFVVLPAALLGRQCGASSQD